MRSYLHPISQPAETPAELKVLQASNFSSQYQTHNT